MFAEAFDTRISMPGATFDAAAETGLLAGAEIGTERLRPVRDGGLITLTARIVAAEPDGALDWVIYLLDPVDQASLYPETQAVKRQCVVHDKPFLSTEAGASEWCTLEWRCAVREGAPQAAALPGLVERWIRPGQLATETLALIAHDRLKPDMLAFAGRHHALLSRFGRRLATGTTGSLLNRTVPSSLDDAEGPYRAESGSGSVERSWVKALRSGPLGGDAEIAEEVLQGRCRRAVFFEDPHVAREHEADIQLLERAARFPADGCLCINSPGVAHRWAANLSSLLEPAGQARR